MNFNIGDEVYLKPIGQCDTNESGFHINDTMKREDGFGDENRYHVIEEIDDDEDYTYRVCHLEGSMWCYPEQWLYCKPKIHLPEELFTL